MRVSINLSNHTFSARLGHTGAELADVAQAADEVGLHTIWVPDHVIQADPTAGSDRDMLEAYTTMGYLAAVTSAVHLGAMVTGVTFRPPALLIKAVTTVDVLSDGRAWLGLGAGYLTGEATAMGLPLPPTGERFEHLEDTVRIAEALWSGDETPFYGRRHRLERPTLHPAAVTRPHPPILIGGSGERRTLRLVAQHADACNLFDIPDGNQTLRRKLDVLAEHCRVVGRNPAAIEKTLSTRRGPDQTVDEFIEHCRDVAALGIDHIVMHSGPAWTVPSVGNLRPLVEALGPIGADRPAS
jgi:F420-dependent oxidoreductase-like protein